jgi:hypothetical protein
MDVVLVFHKFYWFFMKAAELNKLFKAGRQPESPLLEEMAV